MSFKPEETKAYKVGEELFATKEAAIKAFVEERLLVLFRNAPVVSICMANYEEVIGLLNNLYNAEMEE